MVLLHQLLGNLYQLLLDRIRLSSVLQVLGDGTVLVR